MSDDESEVPEWITNAVAAEPDTEDKLRRLWDLQERRRPNPQIEAEYEALRNELKTQLAKEGPRYFIAGDNEKHYAYALQPEGVDVDVDALVALYEDGKLPKVDIDEIAPRKVDPEAFRRAAATKRIPTKVVAKVAKIKPRTGYVKFGQGDDA